MKNLFHFSKQQRIGTVILIVLVVAVAVTDIYIIPHLKNAKNSDEMDIFYTEAATFESQLKNADSLRAAARDSAFAARYKAWDAPKYQATTERPAELFTFDPNKTDSITFVRLGLSPRVAANILKYRAKGGRFRNAEHFGQTYGISDEKFAQLRPYIQIDSLPISQTSAPTSTPTLARIKRDTILELNTADTASLQLLRGIGRGYAVGIVRYRNLLGGYCRVEQLREVRGINEETYQKIRANFTVDASLITPIDVNKASLEQLMRHPYLDFTKAKAIYEYRRNKFKIKDFEELKKIPELDAPTREKMRLYLIFGK